MFPADDPVEADVTQVFLTRFNLPTSGPESLIRAQEGWLRHRWELFTRFTVPSVRAQTEQRFTWLVYFDPASPQWLLRAIARHEAEHLYLPLFREEAPLAEVIADIQRLAPRSRELLTTNLDNDDGLAQDFAERLRAHRPAQARSAIYFSHGLIRSAGALYLRTDRDNAFCSVREPWEEPMSCWCDWHVLLKRHMPVTEIDGPPAWLQLVHDSNVSNRIHGRLARPDMFHPQFPGLLDDVPAPSRPRLLLDRTVTAPVRSLRDVLRALIKGAIMRFGGKAAIDRLKTMLARTQGRSAPSHGGAA